VEISSRKGVNGKKKMQGKYIKIERKRKDNMEIGRYKM
jgi:hypothetical protein